MSTRVVIAVLAILGCAGVAMGAFGAHSLPQYLAKIGVEDDQIVKRVATLDTGVRYQLFHILAMFAWCAWWRADELNRDRLVPKTPLMFMGVGIVCFCGWLYLNAWTGNRRLPLLAPLGGLSFMLGWLSMAIIALRRPTPMRRPD